MYVIHVDEIKIIFFSPLDDSSQDENMLTTAETPGMFSHNHNELHMMCIWYENP